MDDEIISHSDGVMSNLLLRLQELCYDIEELGPEDPIPQIVDLLTEAYERLSELGN